MVNLTNKPEDAGVLIYAGDKLFGVEGLKVLPWFIL